VRNRLRMNQSNSTKRFFITHSHADNAFAKRFADDLKKVGLDGFFDIYSIKLGDNIPAYINKGLAECDVYVPVLSNEALNSPWCEEEITTALMLSKRRDRLGRPRIIPIFIEECQARISQQYPTLLSRLYVSFVNRYDEALYDLLVQGFGLPVDILISGRTIESLHSISPANSSTNSASKSLPQNSKHNSVQSYQNTVKLVDLEAVFDREKYREKYKGFRISNLSASPAKEDLHPMSLKDPIRKSIIYSLYNTPLFPPAEPIYSKENRLPIGVTFEREFEIGGSNLSFAFFGLSADVFAIESLREDTGGPEVPKGSIGFFACYRTIYTALLFGKRYYSALGLDTAFQLHFSLESSIPRTLIMDSRHYWPFLEQHTNEMKAPVSVKKTITRGVSITEIDAFASEIIREFCWYFHLDLSSENALKFLEKLKKEDVAIPKEMLQDD
jgi:hypothetical protein